MSKLDENDGLTDDEREALAERALPCSACCVLGRIVFESAAMDALERATNSVEDLGRSSSPVAVGFAACMLDWMVEAYSPEFARLVLGELLERAEEHEQREQAAHGGEHAH